MGILRTTRKAANGLQLALLLLQAVTAGITGVKAWRAGDAG